MKDTCEKCKAPLVCGDVGQCLDATPRTDVQRLEKQLAQAVKDLDEARQNADEMAERWAAASDKAATFQRALDYARACIRDAIAKLPSGAKGIRTWTGGEADVARRQAAIDGKANAEAQRSPASGDKLPPLVGQLLEG